MILWLGFQAQKSFLAPQRMYHILPYTKQSWPAMVAANSGTRKCPMVTSPNPVVLAFWESFRKCHHHLYRNQESLKLKSLTCQVPWPPVAARGVAQLGGTGLLYLLSRIYFWEMSRRKDFWGAEVAWRRHSSSAGNALWLPAHAQGNCRMAGIGWCNITDWIKQVFFFPFSRLDTWSYEIMEGKTLSSKQAVPLKPPVGSESLLKLETNKWLSSSFILNCPLTPSFPSFSPNPLWKPIESSFGFRVIKKYWLFGGWE